MYWDSYIIRSLYNNEGNVILNIRTSRHINRVMSKSDDVADPVPIFNITFPSLLKKDLMM
jgi:hypothetical protein